MADAKTDQTDAGGADAAQDPYAFEKPIGELEQRIDELRRTAEESGQDFKDEIVLLERRLQQVADEIYADLNAWQRIQVARHPERPLTGFYLRHVFDDSIELHGDRFFKDDPAIVTALATLDGRRVMVIGQRKGANTAERMKCHWGMAHPEGYRKALRKMRLAEKFGLPVVTLINTAGAYPGIGAEERGQAFSIAENLMAMARLRVPIVCVVIGEGGSGGALGIGLGDRMAILANAYFSVISPEGCAAILWRDGKRAPDAAEALRLTPESLKDLGIMDDIVPEPLGGAHRRPEAMADVLRRYLRDTLDELCARSTDDLLEERYRRVRSYGRWLEGSDARRSVTWREPVAAEAARPGAQFLYLKRHDEDEAQRVDMDRRARDRGDTGGGESAGAGA